LGRHLGHQLHLRPTPGDATQGVYAQLCRSATKWSQGISHEMSIQNAYIDLISHANRIALPLILVDDRFHLHRESVLQYLRLWTTLTLVTATGDKQSPVKNQIGKVIHVLNVLIIGFGGEDSPSSQRGRKVQGRGFDACCSWICRYRLPFRLV
jgi:hypothetical protein